MKYASDVAKKVWDVAANLGYSNMFIPGEGAAITDDHVFVNQLANIPCIDIIDCDPSSQNPFVEYWHTTYDTMANIDIQSLKAVGETLLKVIYSE